MNGDGQKRILITLLRNLFTVSYHPLNVICHDMKGTIEKWEMFFSSSVEIYITSNETDNSVVVALILSVVPG